MLRLTIICTAMALLLSACEGDTSGRNAASAGGYGTGGTNGYGANGYGANGGQNPTGGALGGEAGDRIYFDSDQSVVTQEDRATLDRQAQWLQQNPGTKIWVAGNCDERGTEEYNLALGQRRADADRDYLAAHGIDPRRIQTISYGKDRPVDSSSTQQAWAHNRNAITSVR